MKPIPDPFHPSFSFFSLTKSNKTLPKSTSIPTFFKQIHYFSKKALGPISNCRSRDLLQIPPVESSGNLHATDLVKKEGQKLAKECFLYSVSILLLWGWLPGNLGPFSNERSSNSAPDTLNESSVRWNLTCFMSIQRYRIAFPDHFSLKVIFLATFEGWDLHFRKERKIPFQIHLTRALYDLIWTVSC